MEKFIPLNDRVLVLKDVVAAEATTATGIIVPDSAKSALNTGTVIEVAEDVKVIKKGDKVLFNPYANINVEVNGKEHLVLATSDVYGILETQGE